MKRFLILFFALVFTACSVQRPAATPTPSPTAMIAPATPTAAPLTAPTVREKFFLRELAGIGRHPYAAAVMDGKVYVLNSETENIAVIQNDRAVKYIPVGKHPAALAADAAQKRLYISTPGDKSISVIENDQVTRTQNIGGDARTLLFSENRLWAGLDNSATILVLDPATLQTQDRLTIPNAFSIISLAGDTLNHRVYANAFEKTAVIDSATLRVLNTLKTKNSYFTVAAHSSSNSVLVAIYDPNSQTQSLVAFDPQTGAERGRAKLGGDPRGAAMNRDGSRIYVANMFTNDVSVIDPRGFANIATISVGLAPQALALDEEARRLYVANYESDSVSVINTETNALTATIPLAMLPTALEANESARRVYVANASTDSVFVLEGARLVKEISVGRHPIDLARDPQTNRLFVANRGDGTISIIDENDFSVRATQTITRLLSTVAVDAPRHRVLANDVVLELNSLAPAGKLNLRGVTIGSNIVPLYTRVNSAANRVYALGSNGTPGSNGRIVVYSVDAATLQQRAMLGISGNTDHIAFDVASNRLFAAGTHPFAFTNELGVWDVNDAKIISLGLPARTTGMVFNPQTNHLFLAHAASPTAATASAPNPADNTIQILDTNSFGEVTRLTLKSPGEMTRVGNILYVANRDDGSIALIEDVNAPTPPSPVPTPTR